MGERDHGQGRVFHISVKASHAWLLENNLRNDRVRERISDEIISNAQEVGNGINGQGWTEILNNVKHTEPNWRSHRGKWAIYKTIAIPAGMVGRTAGWDMHAPEMAYISTFHMLTPIADRITFLEESLAAADSRRFKSEAERDATLASERNEAQRFRGYREELTESLDEYATQHGFEAGKRKVLEALLSATAALRNKMLAFLQSGEIDKAVALLERRRR
jgi:hypothetical protein